MLRISCVALLLALPMIPAAASAQPAWDVTAAAGLFAGHVTARDDGRLYEEDWFQAAQGGVVLGRYLSPHLKLEVEATATTEGLRYVSRAIEVPGSPYPNVVGSEVRTAVRSLGGVVAWQFRDNEWVHPFVEAGVSADVERVAVYTPEQFFRTDPNTPPGSLRVSESRTEETTTVARAVLGGGAKLYFKERAFVRTDARLTWGSGRQHIAVRAGVGLDF